MELKVKQITFPEAIEFNFSELKQEIEERTASYVGLVYSEDQIKDAKKDAAMLRKFTKALSDERIRVKKDLMKPYEEFEGKIKELTGIVDKAIGEIDVQIKSYEEQKKQEKLENIQEYYNSIEEDDLKWLGFPAIYNEKWLNASVSMKSIQEEINARLEQIKNDLATLSNLPEFGFEATEVYKTSLDMNKAISEAQRMSQIQKAKAEKEAEAKKERIIEFEKKNALEHFSKEEIDELNEFGYEITDKSTVEIAVVKQWVGFQALLTVEQAKELKQFFDDRNIEFKAV